MHLFLTQMISQKQPEVDLLQLNELPNLIKLHLFDVCLIQCISDLTYLDLKLPVQFWRWHVTELSWIHTRTQAVFYRFVACAFLFFEVKSVLPIDRYQNATSKAISLHELKKTSTPRAIHARDTGFYWSSENALHDRFIASSGVGVWMKTLQLIAKRSKNASVRVWIQL